MEGGERFSPFIPAKYFPRQSLSYRPGDSGGRRHRPCPQSDGGNPGSTFKEPQSEEGEGRDTVPVLGELSLNEEA